MFDTFNVIYKNRSESLFVIEIQVDSIFTDASKSEKPLVKFINHTSSRIDEFCKGRKRLIYEYACSFVVIKRLNDFHLLF